MNQGRNTLLVIAAVVIFFYFWMTSQSTTRGLPAKPAGSLKPVGPCRNWITRLKAALNPKQPAGGGGGKSGGGSGGGSGSGAASGQRSCNKTPGSSFCGCASCLAYAGKDSNGNEIYQKSDGSLVYSDGSPASQADIACSEGSCIGTVCNQPQDVPTAQPCSNAGAGGGCSGGGCFSGCSLVCGGF